MKIISYRFQQFRLKIVLFLYDDLANGHLIVQFLFDIASFYQDIVYTATTIFQ